MGDFAKDSIAAGATLVTAFLGTAVSRYLKGTSSFPSLKSYKLLFKHSQHGTPWPVKNDLWRRDDVWGSVFLCGPNSGAYLEQVKDRLPEGLAHISDDLLHGKTGAPHPYMDGAALTHEIAAGRIFVASYPVLKGMSLSPADAERFGQKFLAEGAMCLLRARPATSATPFQFLPLCITLESERGSGAPLFLPTDPEYEWLNARCHLMNASAQSHQIGTHYGYSHAASEAVCIATFKRFSQAHPIRRLLLPHVQFTLAINGAARKSLVNAA